MQMLFAMKGAISHIQLLRDCDRRSLGMCFVTYRRKADARSALRAFRGHVAQGKRWHVTVVAPRKTTTHNTVSGRNETDDTEMGGFEMAFSAISLGNTEVEEDAMDLGFAQLSLSNN
jgi:RNA recognition motif-containing protein